MEPTHLPSQPARRDFLAKLAAAGLGTVSLLVPAGSGILVFLDPLRRKSPAGQFVRVASLQALPEDGTPRKFIVVTDHVDAWNKAPQVPIGAVYLRRTGEQSVQALNVVCPHLGCFVDYSPAERSYLCPCHNSRFSLDGKISETNSPSPRAMDELEVKILPGGEILVKFQNFRAGTAGKIPV